MLAESNRKKIDSIARIESKLFARIGMLYSAVVADSVHTARTDLTAWNIG